jgi:hypothetical protein
MHYAQQISRSCGIGRFSILYRGLISTLQPKALLIEEPAETLKGYVVAGMVDSFEHLVLVGDHKQLQANCTMGWLSSSGSASSWRCQCWCIA